MALTKSDKTFLEIIFAKQKVNFEKALFKQDIRIENELIKQEQKFESKVFEFKSEVFNKIDPLLKEVTDSREDRGVAAEHNRRNNDRIEKLEKIHPQNQHLATI